MTKGTHKEMWARVSLRGQEERVLVMPWTEVARRGKRWAEGAAGKVAVS